METLARLTYNIERRAAATARREEKKRGRVHGNLKPGNSGKKGLHARVKKKVKGSGLKPGDLGETAETRLAEEIKSTGSYGPGDVEFASTPAIHEFPGISSSFRLRFSYLTDQRFANMLRDYRTLPIGRLRPEEFEEANTRAEQSQ
jgi:hypothetical protein